MKLKIGIACDAIPPTVDGIANAAHNYGKYINKNHGEAIMLTPRQRIHQSCRYPYDLYEYNSWIYPPMYKEGYRIGWPFKEYIREEVRELHCDLYHSHCPLASSYLIKLALQKQKVPYVITYHTKYEIDIDKRVPTKWAKNFGKNFILKNLLLADEIWVTSEGTVQSLRNIGYMGDYVLMPNGVDMEKGAATEEKQAEFRKKYGISDKKFTLLFVGRVMWYKNIELTLNALKIIKSKGIDFQFIIAGAGPDLNSVKRRIRKMGLDKDVIFVGRIDERDELKACYSIGDLFLFPSTFDTNGLVVREAAACCCPSLLVRGSCASERIIDGRTGILCDESADDIARAIIKFNGNRDALKEIGRNAENEIYLSWADAVATAYARYEMLCSNFKYENK